ncbi:MULTISPECIES: VWA domain-containing protein [unclassified Rhodococcus (in: high G+C Gram-positive bacteria)]|uniref:VWA domain-containing protein n=1 Tax=unclassified Rhodococcus (in: high G+C Gram-positive bacteria) TaxID=192944 RepID=UPI00163ACE93|nr:MULTISPECIES: VWA domain-containing protein [unclassified Rhodococcus (in: high G+C Gram-positive bacteria)]MBC2643790.1 VWA domain-containing protein [Rhodococcus sp. 3A]MBC2891469.1 VWA domain-containing protein [Rhodococcus sp. 4CII]
MDQVRPDFSWGFPFSAVVGQDRLRLALVLCAVHPGIGGVLVRGEKGTAKSTVVRALTALLPAVHDENGTRPARLVELPVGATEDRVVGSLDLEKVLRDGERAFQPGLLSAAHQGVLYVDEVNLLHDHLVDVLLDAAAMGRVHVERDGISHSHAARFVLVGTMNPEEGELRPQLLDRFGLAVDVSASRDVDVRMEVVRRRLEFERDPARFAGRYAEQDAALAAAILAARDRLVSVELDDVELRRIASLCASFDVDGMRADLVLARTATAHAAWRGAAAVTAEDVRVAAELTLPHRRRRDPFDEPGLDEQQLDEALRQADEDARAGAGEPDEPEPGSPPDSPPGAEDTDGTDPDGPDDPDGPGGGAPPPQERPAGPTGTQFTTKLLEVPGVGEGAPGRRSRSRSSRGRAVRSTAERGHGLHLVGTLFAAAGRQVDRGRTAGRMILDSADLRGAIREGREGNLVVFVVDASGSMAARDRLSAVTGAVVSLLRDAYQRRDKVAVITVRGRTAELVLPPTSSVDIAVRRLRGMKTGGKSPLAEGFLRAREVVLRERLRDPQRRALVVALTDGRATGGKDALHRAKVAAGLLADSSVASVVVDCETGMVRLGLAAELSRQLRGGYVRLGELSAQQVAGVVRAAA